MKRSTLCHGASTLWSPHDRWLGPSPIAQKKLEGWFGGFMPRIFGCQELASFAVSMCVEEEGYDVDPVRQSLSNWDEFLFFRARWWLKAMLAMGDGHLSLVVDDIYPE